MNFFFNSKGEGGGFRLRYKQLEKLFTNGKKLFVQK